MASNPQQYCYEYPRPAVTTDCVLFGYDGQKMSVLLIERAHDPYRGCWAFPGGFLDMDEDADTCAYRELKEETSIENIMLEQFHCFSSVNRDPRGRVISIVYLAMVTKDNIIPKAGDDAAKAQWFYIDSLPKLAFDHQLVMETALNRLKEKAILDYSLLNFFDNTINLESLNRLYSEILGIELLDTAIGKTILAKYPVNTLCINKNTITVQA